jgi:hypothetical protein
MNESEKEHRRPNRSNSRRREKMEAAPLSSSGEMTSMTTTSTAQAKEMLQRAPAADASSSRAPIDLEPHLTAKPTDVLLSAVANKKSDDSGSKDLAAAAPGNTLTKNNEDGAKGASSSAVVDVIFDDI